MIPTEILQSLSQICECESEDYQIQGGRPAETEKMRKIWGEVHVLYAGVTGGLRASIHPIFPSLPALPALPLNSFLLARYLRKANAIGKTCNVPK